MPYHQQLPARSITDNMLLPHQLQGNGNSASTIITQPANSQTVIATAGETILYGQPCYIASDGKVYLSSRDYNPAMFIAITSGNEDDEVTLMKHGTMSYQHDYPSGTKLFLGNSNLIDNIRKSKIVQQLAEATDDNMIIVNIQEAESSS